MSGTLKEWQLNNYENIALQRLRKAGIVDEAAVEVTPGVHDNLLL